MWELNYKESWAPKNWCFWTVMLEKTLESPLDCSNIQPVHLNQSWIFIARTYVEAETPIIWPPDAKKWLIWKDPDVVTDWRQEEKGTTEDEMVGWHHWLNGHGFGRTPGVGDGQGGLACCSSWDRKELDTTEQLNWTEPWEISRLSRTLWTEILFSNLAVTKQLLHAQPLAGCWGCKNEDDVISWGAYRWKSPWQTNEWLLLHTHLSSKIYPTPTCA